MIKAPYVLRWYALDDEMVARAKKVGIEPNRQLTNDGAVPIAGTDENGELVTIAHVLPIAPRKRNTPYDAPDPERDKLAEQIVLALNSHEAAL